MKMYVAKNKNGSVIQFTQRNPSKILKAGKAERGYND